MIITSLRHLRPACAASKHLSGHIILQIDSWGRCQPHPQPSVHHEQEKGRGSLQFLLFFLWWGHDDEPDLQINLNL